MLPAAPPRDIYVPPYLSTSIVEHPSHPSRTPASAGPGWCSFEFFFNTEPWIKFSRNPTPELHGLTDEVYIRVIH